MTRCCLWGPRQGTESLVGVPTICDAHRALVEAARVSGFMDVTPTLEENPYYRTLVDADGIDYCRRAVDWRRSNRAHMTSVETEDK